MLTEAHCGAAERHESELYPAVENIDPTRTKTRHPRLMGSLNVSTKPILNELYRVAFRKKIHRMLEKLHTDLEA